MTETSAEADPRARLEAAEAELRRLSDEVNKAWRQYRNAEEHQENQAAEVRALRRQLGL